jgi:RNA polymerase sigma-70 factor, ECF subfamily
MSNSAASVSAVQRGVATARVDRHAEARAWLTALRGTGAARRQAEADLHALLLRAARFELARRRATIEATARESLEDLALQSANDALSALLRKLDEYRFESRFTTWAYKFAVLEAAVRARRSAWQRRELPVDPEAWTSLPTSTLEPAAAVAEREQLRSVMEAIRTKLSPHQREVLSALVIAEVPIDVLAERMGTTRGALYKTLHDARRKLRQAIGAGYE